MLKKLLKYDLEWCFKPLIVFYILTIIFAIITRIVEDLEQTLIVLIIDKICSGIIIAMIVNIIINCFMRNWARFIKNIYKDESYLTHTLPVSKNELYLSKVLTAIITLLASFIVIVVSLAICCLNKDTWESLKITLEQSAVYFDSSVFSLVVTLIATIFFEFLFMLMSGILGIIIGHKSNNLKIIKSIISGFIIYMVLSLISLGILYISGLINPDIMSIFNDMEASSNAIKSTAIIGISVYIVYTVIVYIIGNKLLNKGVNVD